MKIIFISPFGAKETTEYGSKKQQGAIENQIFNIGMQMVSMGHEVLILRNWDDNSNETVINGIKIINIPVFGLSKCAYDSLKFRSLLYISKLIYSFKIYRKICQLNPDITNFADSSSSFFIFLINLPKVFIIHNYGGLIKEKNRSTWLKITDFFREKFFKYWISQFDLIITLSETISKSLFRLGIENTAIIPNSLILNEYYNNPDEDFVLYGGKLVEIKKVEDLIRAFYLIKDHVTSNLIIAGIGPCEKKLKDLVTLLNLEKRIKIIPILPRNEFIEVLSRSSLFVLPSVIETFPMVILETMACSKCIIARDIPGPNNIILHKFNGLLFEDVKNLSELLFEALSNSTLRLEIGKNGRKTVEKNYAIDKIVVKYIENYNKLIRGKNDRKA